MNEMHVVPRDAIPPIQSAEQDGALHELGELRDFRWNSLLRDFMPAASGFSLGWVRLKYGEVLLPQVHPVQSLMVFYAGSGTILGDMEGPVAKDDVAVIPAGCKHGFVGGPGGLYGLSIRLGEVLESASEHTVRAVDGFAAESSFSGLLDHNQKCLQDFQKRAIFELLRDGTLEEPMKRKKFLEALEIWSDGSQSLRLCRQASCLDPKYATSFSRDGYRAPRLKVSRLRPAAAKQDATMRAISDWFTYQMFVLDNAEKVAVQLVIESATCAYQNVATVSLGLAPNDGGSAERLSQATLDAQLLRDQSARSCARLHCIIDEAWEMFSAMTDRLVELTRQV